MEELSQLSPASREAALEALPRKELQQLAKEIGVKGNSKSKDIVQALLSTFDGNSATEAETVARAQDSSSVPVTSELIPESTTQPECSTSQAAVAEAAVTLPAVASGVDAHTAGVYPEALKCPNMESISAAQSSTVLVQQQEAYESLPAEPAEDCGPNIRSALESANARQPDAASDPQQAAEQPAAEQPAAVAAQDPDCISNPLYEEPSASELAVQPGMSDSEGPHPSANCDADRLGPASQHLQAGDVDAAALAQQQARADAPLSHTPVPATDNGNATQADNAELAAMAAADGRERDDQASAAAPQLPGLATDDAAAAHLSIVASKPASAAQAVAASSPRVPRGVREPTPEDVANLGKAVAVVQARSCQLSPSLLTLQSSADLGNDAFERGRKSGIWQGATEVELRQLERQWDDYKSVATRGWELPSLQDVQAKSDALTASGFASVGSPVISKSMREAMAKQGLSGKRKARSEEEQAPARRSNSARKVVKRAQGLTPSRKGSAQQGTPQRNGSRAGPSRLALASNAADLENTGRAANAARTPQGKASTFGGGLPATPFSMGTTQKTAGNKGSRVSAIPKPRPAGDRAKKAEAAFAARRAAALAKGKK